MSTQLENVEKSIREIDIELKGALLMKLWKIAIVPLWKVGRAEGLFLIHSPGDIYFAESDDETTREELRKNIDVLKSERSELITLRKDLDSKLREGSLLNMEDERRYVDCVGWKSISYKIQLLRFEKREAWVNHAERRYWC